VDTEFNKTVEQLCENANCIKSIKRVFYPKGIKLEEDFIGLAKRQHKQLTAKGMHPREATAKIAKALLFHLR
jgi:hypothetical protein